MAYQFPELPYAYDALEPHIDAKTMEVHYSKHHRTYYDKFIAAITDTDINGESLHTLFEKVSTLPGAIRNHGGGFFNHNLFWRCMSPQGGGQPSGILAEAITRHFGSFEQFKQAFSDAAATHFGSGFVWLIVTEGRLEITSTINQDNPLMDVAEVQGEPILALDIWEHAYYLSYQNRRPDYIDAWWQVVDWAQVSEHYQSVLLATQKA
ncbi:superoxide dismutase [Thaumasiovibrio subtropicus]|uniref:superoxide dismutase n=1 Tax=Thaumasiovibrio subtropicus TaxID=1891207 RepID=UPI000B35CC75|nr:superoxide dismutase [Thaumasiovibrio subtropicus]